MSLDKNGKYDWCANSNNWIGWSAYDHKQSIQIQNRNGNYLTRLLICKSGDIVILSCNSDLGRLSFQLFKSKFSLLDGRWINDDASIENI